MTTNRLTKAQRVRCWLWRAAGKTAIILLALPFYAFERAFSWLADAVTLLCSMAAMPAAIFYDWCVKRHNAIRARATLQQETNHE